MKLILCMQINIKLFFRLILLILVGMARPAQITHNNKFENSLQYLMKEVKDEVDFLYTWASEFSINWYCPFWWVWPGMPKVLKITIMQCFCNISRKNRVTKLMFSMLINVKVDTVIFHGFVQACPKYPGKFAISLWHLKTKSRMKLGT